MQHKADEQIGGASLYFLQKAERVNYPDKSMGLRHSAHSLQRPKEDSYDNRSARLQTMTQDRFRAEYKPKAPKVGSSDIKDRLE